MCTLWGLMTGTGFNINKRHKEQAVTSRPGELQRFLLVSGGQFVVLQLVHLHVDDMMWPKRINSLIMEIVPSCGLAV